MRTHGTLMKWNDDRGFGFISPAQGDQALFVHISAFPKDGERPRINELISFETEAGPDGKLRAVRVMRPGRRAASAKRPAKRRPIRVPKLAAALIGVLAVAAIAWHFYPRAAVTVPEPATLRRAALSPAPVQTFACDGRTMCSQMRSCEEARYFLKHCPGTKMDGDHDGEPCEQQCN
jgi:cold shock CspA family protein